jgi:DNA-binding response OmpR family regulator
MGHDSLRGLRILVVEDDLLIAEELDSTLTSFGSTVIGPVATVERATHLAQVAELDGAILDVGLGGKAAYPIAECLQSRNVPFIFATGHDPSIFPEEYRKIPQLRKPFGPRKLARLAAMIFGRRRDG